MRIIRREIPRRGPPLRPQRARTASPFAPPGEYASLAAAVISRSHDFDAFLVSILLPVTTFSILCYEIALTRLFAYIFTYDLTAVAVSFAVFGLGSGAYVRVRWLSVLPQRTLAVGAHLASSASLLVLYVVLILTHDMAAVIVVSCASPAS